MQDRRVKRTQTLLANALIALTLEKGYEAVSIRDITDRADVGYATFFRHYHDKDALLHEVVEVVLVELMSLLRTTAPDAEPVTIGTLMFEYVQAHSAVCRVLLSSPGSALLVRRIIEAGTNSILAERTRAREAVVPLEVAAYHVVSSAVGLIRWWLEHDMPYPPERMGMIYAQLIFTPTSRLAFG